MQRERLTKLNKALPLLATGLVLIQPVLDVIAYWNQTLGLSNLWTSVVRLLLLAGGFALGFLVSERRRVYLGFSAAVLFCLGGHVLACLGTKAGYLDWAEDLTDQLRTLVLPVTALTLMSWLRANPRVFPAMLRALAVNLGVIAGIMALSAVTGTDPHTYPTKALGVRGWFIWTSPQSAILSLLTPLTLGWTLSRWPERVAPAALAALLSFGLLYLFGTRLSYATAVSLGVFFALWCFLEGGRQRRAQAGAILLCAALVLCLYPLSPMVKNRAALAENEQIKQRRILAAVQAAEEKSALVLPDRPAMNVLAAAYRYNLQGMIDRFGLVRVAERYDYTLDAAVICNDRTMKSTFCALLMEDMNAESPLSRFFGLELARTRVTDTEVYDFYADDWVVDTENFDPENDFFGVLTLSGLVGVGLLALCLAWIGLRAIWEAWGEPARRTPVFAAFIAAYGIALIYAVNTASTLRRNNASVYFAFVLAGLYYLSTRSIRGDVYD